MRIAGLVERDRARALRAVRMLAAGVDFEFADHRPPACVFGQHPFDGEAQQAVGMARAQPRRGLFAQAARIAAVAAVEFVGFFVAGQPHFVGVDNDDKIADIEMRRIHGLVLSCQAMGDGGGEATERAPVGVEQKPLAPDLGRAQMAGFVDGEIARFHKRRIITRRRFESKRPAAAQLTAIWRKTKSTTAKSSRR